MKVDKIMGTVKVCFECGSTLVIQDGGYDKCPLCGCAKLIDGRDAVSKTPEEDHVTLEGYCRSVRMTPAEHKPANVVKDGEAKPLAPIIDIRSYMGEQGW